MKSFKIIIVFIFIIIVIGVLFFTLQLVRSPKYRTPIAPQDKAGTSKTFIDTKRNFSFSYPVAWQQYDPSLVPGYAPILTSTESAGTGYMAFSKTNLNKETNNNADIEKYSDALPITKAVSDLVGAPVELMSQEVKRLTYPSGIGGFIISYTGKVATEGATQTIVGKIHMYYIQNQIMYGFSAFIPNLTAMATTGTVGKSFLDQADLALQSLVTY